MGPGHSFPRSEALSPRHHSSHIAALEEPRAPNGGHATKDACEVLRAPP